MEAHPVPQNVTSFEFHLVGDMTLKQFGYLAGGVGMAYIIFITIGTKAPFLAWPFILIFAMSGVAFAFLPISDRPLDHWVTAFFRAIFQPTQRLWKANLSNPENFFKDRLLLYVNSHPQDFGTSEPLTSHSPNLSSISQQAPKTQMLVSLPFKAPTPQPILPVTPAAPPAPKPEIPTAKELEQTVEFAKKAQNVQSEIVETEHRLEQIKAQAAGVGANPKDFADDFQKVLSELQNLTQEASNISHQMAVLSKTPPASTTVGPSVRVVTPVAKKPIVTNLVLTSTPNVINGIVTDTQNNYLEGVIVVTHDRQGLPVRALKSNKLGQFVAATPLPNGNYTITLEKDNLLFETIQVDLTGKVMSPILIASRGGTNV